MRVKKPVHLHTNGFTAHARLLSKKTGERVGRPWFSNDL